MDSKVAIGHLIELFRIRILMRISCACNPRVHDEAPHRKLPNRVRCATRFIRPDQVLNFRFIGAAIMSAYDTGNLAMAFLQHANTENGVVCRRETMELSMFIYRIGTPY